MFMRINLKEQFHVKWNQSPENVALSLVHNYTLSFRQCVSAMSQTDISRQPIGYLMSEMYFREQKLKSEISYLIPVMEHIFRFYECEKEPDIINTHPPESAVNDTVRKRTALMKITARYHKPIDMLFSQAEICEMNSSIKALYDAIILKDIFMQEQSDSVKNWAYYLYTASAIGQSGKAPNPPDYNAFSARALYDICEQGYELFQRILNDYIAPVLTLDEVMILNRYGTGCNNITNLICKLSEYCGGYCGGNLARKIANISEEAGSLLVTQLAVDGIRYSPPYYLEEREFSRKR